MNFVLVDAEEAVQGNTISNVTKKAWISTGYEVTVPQFIKKNETIIIDTRTGKYVGRTK
jgi:elongation factor P